MSDDALAALDATAQAELVRQGQASPSELVEAAIARIERLDPQLNAVIHPAFERARERAADPALPQGPLRGVPLLMKDIGGEEAGQPHHAGMRALEQAGAVADLDSYLTRRFSAAGLISLGRTNLPELALLPTTEPEAYGATKNPWSLAHSAGGSSGGAAAAVASGMVPIAHASDGGGSIRGPASMCSLVGLKPTRGRCSFGPGRGERWNGLSCELVVTRSVRDTALCLDACAGWMPGDPYGAPPPPEAFRASLQRRPPNLRIGLMRQAPRGLPIEADAVAAVDATAAHLEQLGHRVEEAYPKALDDSEHVLHYVAIVATNTARALEAHGKALGRELQRDDVEPLTWALAQQGRAASATGLLATLEYIHRFGRRLAEFWQDGYDLLLTPTQGATPPRLGHLTSTPQEPLRAFVRSAPYGAFTLPFNLSGQPAISVPSHWTADGLPLGSHLVADPGREDLLLQVAAQLEEATGWLDRRPPPPG